MQKNKISDISVRLSLAGSETDESEMSLAFFLQAVFWLKAMERHQGFLTAPNDIPLPLTNQEMAVMARYKPKAPEGNTVPMPKNPDWISLPFKDVWTESSTCRRILFIDYMFEKAANEAARLKDHFGCARRYRI